jgi:hypothetical protein
MTLCRPKCASDPQVRQSLRSIPLWCLMAACGTDQSKGYTSGFPKGVRKTTVRLSQKEVGFKQSKPKRGAPKGVAKVKWKRKRAATALARSSSRTVKAEPQLRRCQRWIGHCQQRQRRRQAWTCGGGGRGGGSTSASTRSSTSARRALAVVLAVHQQHCDLSRRLRPLHVLFHRFVHTTTLNLACSSAPPDRPHRSHRFCAHLC